MASKVSAIVTLENHCVSGGLFSLAISIPPDESSKSYKYPKQVPFVFNIIT